MCKPAVHCQTGMNHIFTQKVNLIPIVAFVQPHWLWSPFCIQWGSNSPLALSARDNLESSFSYVEEAERNRAWRLQICELQLYSPFLSLSLSLSLFLAAGRREMGGHFKGELEVDLVQKNLRIWPSCVLGSDRCAASPARMVSGIQGASKKAFFLCTLSSSICLLSQSRIWRDTKLIKPQKHMGR